MRNLLQVGVCLKCLEVNFLITALVTFGILMVTVKLGMFDSVLRRYGTQRSAKDQSMGTFVLL